MLAFALYLETTRDNLHLVIASTVASARAIVEDGDGSLGLRFYFGNSYRQGKYKGQDAGFIKIGKTTKTVVYLGGAMASSYQVFRGWSVGGIVLEELNLLHENTINEAKGRTLMAQDPKYFISHNPVSSHHKIYEWLEELESKDLVNYDHSTIYDNPALTEERRKQIISQFDPDSIFYKQFILGERVDAQGLVYSIKDYNIIPADKINYDDYIDYIVTADIGDGPSATVFHFSGMRRGFKGVDVLFEYRHRNDDKENIKNPKQPIEYAQDLKEFILASMAAVNRFPTALIIDGSNAFYRDVQSVLRNTNLARLTTKFPYKENIGERIRYSSSLLYQGRLRFSSRCPKTIEAFKSVQYDTKAYEKGEARYLDEPTKGTRCDEVDSCLYGVYYWVKDLNRVSYNININN